MSRVKFRRLGETLLESLGECVPLANIESIILERLLYKSSNQHRRGVYFHKLLQVFSNSLIQFRINVLLHMVHYLGQTV